MAEFRSRALGVLDRIYRFVGASQQSRAMDLSAPITVVHDVAREAEIASGQGQHVGFFLHSVLNSHAGATTELSRTFLESSRLLVSNLNPEASEIWVWPSSVFVVADTDTLNSVRLTLITPSDFDALGAGLPLATLLYTATNIVVATDATGGACYVGQPSSAAMQSSLTPFPVGVGAAFGIRSVSSAGPVNLAGYILCWTGPKGVTPPGVA